MGWLRKLFQVECGEHDWVRDGDSLMYVKCRNCPATGVFTGLMNGLAEFPPNGVTED